MYWLSSLENFEMGVYWYGVVARGIDQVWVWQITSNTSRLKMSALL